MPSRTAHLLIGDVQIGRSFVLHIVTERNCPAVTDAALQRAGALEPAVAARVSRTGRPVRPAAELFPFGGGPAIARSSMFGPQTGRWGAGGQA